MCLHPPPGSFGPAPRATPHPPLARTRPSPAPHDPHASFLFPAVSIYATGQVLHYTHDWSLVFEVAAGLYAAGALAYLTCASCEEQFATDGAADGSTAGAGAALPRSPAKLKSP